MSQSPAEKFFWRKDPTADAKQVAVSAKTAEIPDDAFESEDEKKSASKSSPVLIGIPCHNSESAIAKTIVKLLPLEADIVVCDDGSSDSTDEIARTMGCRIIKHPRELGRSDTVTSIYLAAKKLKSETLLTVGVDSNFSLTDAVQKEGIDIAIGSGYDLAAVEKARREGDILDSRSLFRAYSKKALAMISPAGTGSVVVEKEVLQFANQQGLRIREYPTTARPTKFRETEAKASPTHFETKYMDLVTEKHPLIFVGAPSIGFLYGAVLETVLNSDLAGPIPETVAKFAVSLASSPLFLVSIALSVGTSILYAQKKILARIKDSENKVELL
jgi:glycosyltransferase involved in cell wall biosynthesis